MTEGKPQLNKELFGQVKKLPATGGHIIDEDNITTPFEDDDSVIRTFCKGCGTILEISCEGAENLAVLAGIIVPDPVKNHFFESERCIACADDFDEVELKQL